MTDNKLLLILTGVELLLFMGINLFGSPLLVGVTGFYIIHRMYKKGI